MPDDEEEEAVVVPLIEDLGRDRAALDGPPSPESQLARPNRFIWALTLTAGISGLLFGYEYALLHPLPTTTDGCGAEILTY